MGYYPCSLALGGGGLKGAAHVGVLKVFEEEEFPIEYIAGSSVGALVGAMYATGWSADELTDFLDDCREKSPVDLRIQPVLAVRIVVGYLLKLLKIGRVELHRGLISGKEMEGFLAKIFGGRNFENLRYPLMVTSVNLLNGRLQVFTDKNLAEKLKGVHDLDVHTDANLAQAVRASTAIPGIFTPYSYKGMLLTDGGVKDNVPADLLRFVGAKKVVAVDLAPSEQKEEQVDDLIAVLLHTIEIMGGEVTDLVLERYADLVVRPILKGIGLKDYTKLRDVYDNGYKVARRKVVALNALLKDTRKKKTNVY